MSMAGCHSQTARTDRSPSSLTPIRTLTGVVTCGWSTQLQASSFILQNTHTQIQPSVNRRQILSENLSAQWQQVFRVVLITYYDYYCLAFLSGQSGNMLGDHLLVT